MNYIDIFGELRSREIGGYVTDKSQVRGLSEISLPVRAAYDKSDLTIKFYDANDVEITSLTIKAEDFIKYGLIDDVRIEDRYLVIDFNTKSGKIDIQIPLAEIFNPDNYYLKEEVDEKTTTTADIPVVGGPLADAISAEEWPAEWYNERGIRIIPEDVPMKDVLTTLFFKLMIGTVEWGEVTWEPTLSEPEVSCSRDENTLEVGTPISFTLKGNNEVLGNKRRAICETSGYGYFDSADGEWLAGNKIVYTDGEKSGTAVFSADWNGHEVTVDNNALDVVIGEDVNTLTLVTNGLTASVGALPETTVYASTNTKQCSLRTSSTLTDVKPDDKPLVNTTTISKNGSYYYFIGQVVGSGLNITSDMIRNMKLDKKGFVSTLADEGTEVMSSLSVAPEGYTYIIAVPEGYTVKQILTMGNNAMSAWAEISVDVTLPDGSTKPYVVFYIENIGTEKIDFTNLKLGK